MDLDHEGGTPLYRQIADIIAARVAAGELQPDRPIPSEAAMVQEFGVARLTARRAVRELAERGLVYVVRGKGTFVRPDVGEGGDA
jgi:DNA-binding GntR family transcriptional regulator